MLGLIRATLAFFPSFHVSDPLAFFLSIYLSFFLFYFLSFSSKHTTLPIADCLFHFTLKLIG